MKNPIIALLVATVAIASPVAAKQRVSPDEELQRLIGDRVPGRPVDCISLFSSPSSQIIDHTAIVYRVGGTLFVNEPRSGADSLDSDDILVTRTFGSRLCSIDTVHLVNRASHFPHGFVSLGQFVPYTKAKSSH